jgi:vitamin B12 transporter
MDVKLAFFCVSIPFISVCCGQNHNNMKKFYWIVAAGLGLAQPALFSITAHAQDSTRVLNDVQVTATRSPEKLSETGRDVTIITAETINHSQGMTLPQLLNTVPGITFSGAQNAPGISSSLYLRGASTGNTLILVDGFPVNNASAIDNSYDLNAIPLDQIDHIEILMGSGSTLYGSDAVAGVINIITKHPKGQGLKANVQLSGGTYDTFKEAVGVNGTLNNTGIAVNVSNTDNRGFPAATDTTKTPFRNDDFHQRALNVILDQKVSPDFTLNANLQATRTQGHLPQGSFMDDPNYFYSNTFFFGGIGGTLKLDKGALNVKVTQNDVSNNYDDLASSANGFFPSYQKNTGRITDAEAIFNYSLYKHLDIISGLDYKYFNTDQYSTYDTIRSGKAHTGIGSIYTSLLYHSGIFHMELGGRYNRDQGYGNNFTYTINPSALLFNQLKVFVTAASAFKTPSLYQLDSQYGDQTLKPETTTSYEAGFDWEMVKKLLYFKTAFYHYSTKDVIYFLDTPTPPNYGVYTNGDLQKDKGFESSLKLTLDALTASAYWAYVSGALTDENGVTSDILFRRPKNTVGADVQYHFTEKFSAGLDYKYTGGRTDEDFNPVTFAPVNVPLSAYNMLNANIFYTINKHISLFANLQNVLDVKYTDWIGYNTARFNFMAGIKYQVN